MKIFFKFAGKTIAINADSGDTIENIKYKIQEKEGFPPEQQRIIFGGIILEDKRYIDEYMITKECTLYLAIQRGK